MKVWFRQLICGVEMKSWYEELVWGCGVDARDEERCRVNTYRGIDGDGPLKNPILSKIYFPSRACGQLRSTLQIRQLSFVLSTSSLYGAQFQSFASSINRQPHLRAFVCMTVFAPKLYFLCSKHMQTHFTLHCFVILRSMFMFDYCFHHDL